MKVCGTFLFSTNTTSLVHGLGSSNSQQSNADFVAGTKADEAPRSRIHICDFCLFFFPGQRRVTLPVYHIVKCVYTTWYGIQKNHYLMVI